MKKVNLFIAMSLDGYIADPQGNVNWLEGQGNDSETIDVYSEFIQNIDTIVMGWNTYHQIVSQLSPDEWPYKGFKTYIITHRKMNSDNERIFTSKNPVDLVQELSRQEGKNIWICGGANLIRQLMEKDIIDEYYLTIIPVLLGDGIRLFNKLDQTIKLKLENCRHYNGMVDLIYAKR